MGLLLQDDLFRSMDRFNWSVYHRDGNYYFYGPVAQSEEQTYHGTEA